MIRRDEADANTSAGDPHAVSYRFDGREIGAVGNDSKVDATYLDSVETREATPGTGAFRGGAATGVAYARFGQGFDSVSSYAQGADGGRYTVNGGDTLSSVALQLWGDASLWYKLAQANGLSADSVLIEGQTLTVPAGVIRSADNAATLRPYDPSEAYGDTSPTTPKPIPPKVAAHKNKCGIFGQILLVVIAVAVTIASHGTLTGFLGGSQILGGAAAAAAGSIVSQTVGVATGIQQGFSWKGVAMAAIGGGVAGGLSGVSGLNGASGLAGVAQDAVRGALGSAITQGIGVATGLQSHFDWVGVAAAGIGSAAGSAFSRGVFHIAPDATAHTLTGYLQQAAIGGVNAVANAATRSLVTGTDFGDTIMAALPDVIGSTVGNIVGDGIAGRAGGAIRARGRDNATPNAGGGSPTNWDQAKEEFQQAVRDVSLMAAGGDSATARVLYLETFGPGALEAAAQGASGAVFIDGAVFDDSTTYAGTSYSGLSGETPAHWRDGSMTSFGNNYVSPDGETISWIEDKETTQRALAGAAEFDNQVIGGLSGVAMAAGSFASEPVNLAYTAYQYANGDISGGEAALSVLPGAALLGLREVGATDKLASLIRGIAFENAAVKAARAEAFLPGQSVRRLSVRAFDDMGNLLPGRTVLDIVGNRIDGMGLGVLEFKLHEGVALTARQREHFFYLARNGGQIVGNKGQRLGLLNRDLISPIKVERVDGPNVPQIWWPK